MRKIRNVPALLYGVAVILGGCTDQVNKLTGTLERSPSGVPVKSATESRGRDDVRIVSATGDITASVKEFRDLLGDLNQNVAGEQPGGRREINWDAIPALFTNNDNFPGNFFNVNSKRGVLLTTDGTGFRISSNGYTDVNPNYAGEFVAFSEPKLFVARGSTVTDVQFVVAGSNTQAVVKGFGSVFEDVGGAHSTIIQYFDLEGRMILEIAAPRRSDDNGISFLGAVFETGVV